MRTRVGLNRGEFIESLIRIAKAKYLETGQSKTLIDAFERLIEHVRVHWGDSQPQTTRKKVFWTVDVNDLLGVNLDNLKKVFATCYDLKAV